MPRSRPPAPAWHGQLGGPRVQPQKTPGPAGSYYSPLRYPGGKRPLLPYARAWLEAQRRRPDHLVEGFAGGAGVGLTALCEGRVDRLTLVELDEDVAQFWQVVFSPDGRELAARVAATPTPAAAHARLNHAPADVVERALHTLLLIRLKYNGNRTPSAGWVAARSGKPSSWRYSPATLAERIRGLTARSDAVDVVHGDALTVLSSYARDFSAVFYLDPPYSAGEDQASRLYPHWELDHYELMDVANDLYGDFLMSHQNTPLVRDLADGFRFGFGEVASKGGGKSATELLIARDLRWLERV